MWEMSNGPLEPGVEVRHRCDNPPCVNPAHLIAGTHADNMRDMAERGRGSKYGRKGEAHSMHRLTDADVIAIRASSDSPRVLADRYSVTRENIYMVIKRKSWRHLP